MEFCPICYKHIEKEIWKKENKFKEIRWVFCPNHGYVKDEQQRTSLNARIQAARKQGVYSAESKRPPFIQNNRGFLIGKGAITSFLCMLILLCAALGYFVGVHEMSHKDITFLTENVIH